jgi:uncharacterized protein (DUF885 family)
MTENGVPGNNRGVVEGARGIIDEAWQEVRAGTYVQQRLGTKPERLPDLSLASAQRRTALGKSLLARIAVIDEDALPHDLALTLRLVQFRARIWAREAEWYWTVLDPLGIGMFGMFLPTAYCGGLLLNHVHSQLASFSFESSADLDQYLSLVDDYGRLIEQFAARTAGQAERGMKMPKMQAQRARQLLAQFKSDVPHNLSVLPERVGNLRLPGLLQKLNASISDRVDRAFDDALSTLSEAYLQDAPETVGLGQYVSGTAIYEELVRFHTTLTLTPREVHEQGHARMADIEREMQPIRTKLGFEGDDAAFRARLDRDVRWRADRLEGLTAFFRRYIARLQPRLAECFHITPGAAFGVAPLPDALQESMTYGYYDPPRKGRAEGRYLFNPSNLTQQALYCLGSLTYHELMPGHHLQFALQLENEALHPIRRYSFVTAYLEGWAEYAATLAGEMGCYMEPEEQYGRLMMDAFLTCRLVVDTGMNVMGWSLERARQYMREHTGMSDAEISSDSVRYSCDIPAQALAYKLGDTKILDLRDRMRGAKGSRFDLKDFHAAVLETGAVPLADLEWHLERLISN